jgi:hypothetical protein
MKIKEANLFNTDGICYGTAVEHRSLLNRSGICDAINRCNIFCSCSRFEYKNSI